MNIKARLQKLETGLAKRRKVEDRRVEEWTTAELAQFLGFEKAESIPDEVLQRIIADGSSQ